MSHICFKCKEACKRTVGGFIETNCKYFPPVMQQVRGDVTECENFKEIPKPRKKAKK